MSANATLTLSGSISGGDITKTGSGLLRLTGTSAGGVAVNGGSFELDGTANGAVHLLQGSVSGNGSAASLDTVAGIVGTHPPLGRLRIDGPLKLATDSTFTADIKGPAAGSGYSQIVTRGQPTLAGARFELSVSSPGPSGPPLAGGSVYTIIDNASDQIVSGTFQGLPEGAPVVAAGYVFRLSYAGGTGNDVTLTLLDPNGADLDIPVTANPEPAAAGTTVAYTVRVRNSGPAVATKATVDANIRAGTTFVSVIAPEAWSCTLPPVGATGTVHCTIPVLTSGPVPTSQMTLTVRIDANRTADITTAFTIAAENPDPDTTNNVSTVTTHIGTVPAPGTNRRFVPGVARD